MAGFMTMAGRRMLVSGFLARPLVLRLFTNAAPVGASTAAAELTEADFEGYAPVTLNGKWDIGNTIPMTATHQPVQFRLAAARTPFTIYGYAIMVENTPVSVERIGPYTLQREGDTIVIQPVFVQP